MKAKIHLIVSISQYQGEEGLSKKLPERQQSSGLRNLSPHPENSGLVGLPVVTAGTLQSVEGSDVKAASAPGVGAGTHPAAPATCRQLCPQCSCSICTWLLGVREQHRSYPPNIGNLCSDILV